MQLIDQLSFDTACANGEFSNVVVTRAPNLQWYFTFDWRSRTFSLETQRGKQKKWSDPRTLSHFFYERGVVGYSVILTEPKAP